MRLQSMSTQATLMTGTLLLLAMLLLDVLFSAFWYYQATQARMARMQDMLTFVAAAVNDGREQPRAVFARLPRDSAFCLYLLAGATSQVLERTCSPLPDGQRQESGLIPDKALSATQLVRSNDGQLPGQLLATERPGAATVFQLLLRTQGFILTYIVVYALVLTWLAYYSYKHHIQRPLENLVATADTVSDFETHPFPEQQQLGEYHRLSFNLNRMLRRLEQNRAALKAATAELAQKNEQILANQQEMLRTEKLAATGRLAAGMAHEIGNPLGVVQGYLELMQMDDCTPGERKEYAANALRETKRMHNLISAMLQTARPRDGQVIEAADVNGLVSEFAASMRPQSMLKGIELSAHTEAEWAVAEVSRDSLRQILLNALLNAVDAIRATGASEGRIEVATRNVREKDKDWLELSVSDTGCGLDVEHAGKIFDPFFSTKEPGAGTGLGLSVSLSLVKSMGGSMRAENRAEGGMLLRILLPLTEQQLTDPATGEGV